MTSVLLVEDDVSVRNIFAFALQKEGFEVTLAGSGAEAESKVDERAEKKNNNTFDVILLDMLMMGMSGLDFLKAYDVKKVAPDTKVIALTNFDSDEIKDRARKLGVDDYLDKSKFEPKDLVAYLKELLRH